VIERVTPDPRPGPLLRLTVAAAALATAAVVVSATLELGRAHWGAALVALPFLVALLLAARLSYQRLVVPAAAAVVLLLAAIASGGLVALSGSAEWATSLHIGAAGASLAASVVCWAVSLRGTSVPFGPWRDYLTLTKPRIMILLLITGAAGMFVGAGGAPDASALTAMLVGLALACGGASALNHVLDADIDRLMGERTRSRPVASGRVPAPRALEFGLALSALSFALLASTVNVLTAVLALVGNAFYVVVYTGWLKRTTDQNIVIGGAAGAVPPLVGYAAATGDLGLPALALFVIVFLWTPPHFWALALMIKDHYANAGVPMLPVSRGDAETRRQILVYSAVLVGVTLLVGIWLGPVYTVAAGLLGAWLLVLAARLRRDPGRAGAVALFHYSLAYLALLFAAAAVDPMLL
jgi:protoheme IX farnesyltransferase